MTPEQGRLAAAAFAALSWLVSPALAQQSAALFDAPMVMFDENTSIRKLADVDGDGRLEALGWWYTDSYSYMIYLSLYRQDAAGTWPLAWRQTFAATPNITHREPVLDVGNFDGDARADWAISFRADLRVYSSQPDGTPSLLWSTLEPEPIDRILVIDWDGDGRDDLAVATPTRIRLWRNAGSSFVMTGEVVFGLATRPVNLERGDVDGGGLPDLIHSDEFTVRLFTVQNQAPVLGQQFTHHMSDVRPASGDIDGDGDKDIVVFSTWNTPVRYLVLRRTGPGTFVQEPIAAGGPARYLVDVDGDGDLDGVCCGGGGGPYPTPNKTASTFRIALNDNGAFAPAISIPGMGSERLAAAVDIEGDGDIDLVGGRCIYYARGPISSDPYVHLHTGVRTAYDVEGDGDFDLDLRSGSVLRNSADGRFAAGTVQFPPAPLGTSWGEGGFAGDFDGDGCVDLLVRHLQGTQLLSMRLMRNCGGGFTDAGAAGPAGVDFHPMSEWQTDYKTSMTADLDRDGDLDLLTFTRDGAVSHFTLLWRNDGSGRFTAAGRFNIVIPMGAGDIDGDGWTDLLMAFPSGYLSGTLTWLRRTADFTFGQVAGFPAVSVSPFYDHVELADVDGDGDLDILGGTVAGMVGGTPNPQTGLLLNAGAGGFQLANVLPPTEPVAVRRAWRRDIDGDGAMDLAIGQAFASLGTLYFRGGATAEHAALVMQDAALGVPPMVHQILAPTALCDFDGDGDLDALTDQGAVVRCVAIDGPGAGSIHQYGAGFPGTGGITPALGARGPMRAGALVETRLVGVVGGTIGLWVVGTQPQELSNTPLPGMTLLVEPVITAFGVPIGGSTGTAGAGTFMLPLLVPAWFAGSTFYQQFFVLDPGAASGVSSSNGLETRFAPAR